MKSSIFFGFILFAALVTVSTADINDAFIVVFNMLNADLARRTTDLQGGRLQEDGCSEILDEYGSCDVILVPDGSADFMTYTSLWTGLGSYPFGFKVNVDLTNPNPNPTVAIINQNKPQVYVNSSTKMNGMEASICVCFCNEPSCPYCSF